MRKLVFTCILIGLAVLVGTAFSDDVKEVLGIANRQSSAESDDATKKSDGKANKDKPGYPHVVYSEPIAAVANAAESNSEAVAAVSGDFDSDGVADLVSVDVEGQLRLFKGDSRSVFPGAERGDQKVDSPFAAFSEMRSAGSLGFAPDDILVGDFNADGHLDILAAKFGADAFLFLQGDGKGGFAPPLRQYCPGGVTAISAGEIGRPDGQADVAVSFVADGRSYVAVFEHPEGAFSRKPESFPIPQPASSISIGQLDRDPYADIAVGGGETLTVIHGRGQAYPLDMLPDSNIRRPAAAVRSMKLNFTIRSLVAAEMDGTRGDGVALLGTDGGVRYFKASRDVQQPNVRPQARNQIAPARFTPAGIDPSRFVSSVQRLPQTEAEAAAAGLFMANTDDIRSRGLSKILEEKVKAQSDERAKIPANKLAAEDASKAENQRTLTGERKRLFEAGLASKPVEFRSWKMATLANDPRLAAIATSVSAKLIRSRVSTSGVDDLLVADPAGNRVTVVGRWQENGEKVSGPAHIVELATSAEPSAVVPMRINADGLGDLVTFTKGSAVPTVLLSGPAQVFTVNTTDDVGGGNCQGDGQLCGIRRAIFWANFTPGSMIAFDIPGNGVRTIHLNSALPDLNQVTIDGTTQPGYVDKPLIEIKGDLLAGGAIEGFRVTSPNTVIRGMAINEMPGIDQGGSIVGGSGIVLLSYIGGQLVTNTTIESNFLGTNAFGTVAFGNEGNGVQIYDADNNLIGGTIPQARNILSGNGKPSEQKRGVGFAITGGNNNRVLNNYVGTDFSGNLKVSNSEGASVTGLNNQIGGDQPGAGNLISGNGSPPDALGRCGGPGIRVNQLYNPNTAEPLTSATNLKGNLVGTNASGFAALSNCTTGIISTGNINTVIGSITSEGRNTVSGNKYDGIWCGENDSEYFPISGACHISGNEIGTNISGNGAVPNTAENTCVGFCLVTETVWLPTSKIDFAVLGSPGGTTPNGPCTGFCNLISGNYGPWLNGGGFQKSDSGFGLIVNNYIGTNKSGDAALPNFSGGLAYFGSALIGATFADGQGNLISGGNLVSGNYAQGVAMQAIDGGGVFGIRGNTFGLSADGLSAIPNGVGGSESSAIFVNAQGSTSVIVGGPSPTDKNYVTNETSDGNGQKGTGINLVTFGTVAVQNNWIGLDRQGNSAPNSADGIRAAGTGRVLIGGGGQGTENIIANNGRSGVLIFQFVGGSQDLRTRNVSVRQNVIRNNGGLGIDVVNLTQRPILGDGPTENDCQDLDTGANGLQNYPELYLPIQNQNGTLRIDTTLRSLPSRQFTIDYYLNNQADPTTFGEGQIWLGSETMTTNGNSFASASFNTTQQLPVTAVITATATDDEGNTSEFSCAAGVCTQARSFEEAISAAAQVPICIEPIVVTTNGDENDLDGESPVQNRDGLCDVDSNMPGEQCTLRAAIQEANARLGFDLINFAIPGAGIQTITIQNGSPVLPNVREEVEINALSQPGYIDSPVVQLVGTAVNQTVPLVGLRIATSGVTIRGLAINKFVTNIAIYKENGSANNNRIESCYIGLNADGSFDPNTTSQFGISILGDASSAQNNTIGSSYNGNVISNNLVGVIIAGSGAQGNKIIGNKIGTSPAGFSAIPNEGGIIIGSGARDNIVGGELESDANVISGNVTNGIHIGTNAFNNRVTGNYIGTSADGQERVANGLRGVEVASGAHSNTIGGAFAYRNIIGGNNGSANPATASEILLSVSTHSNTVVGNYIGLKKDGIHTFGGVGGIVVSGSDNIIGGMENSPNLFGVSQFAILVTSDGATAATANEITYNRIGTTPDGGNAVGTNAGVVLTGEAINTRISNNLISGNTAFGIYLNQGSSNTSILSNKIGTRSDGNTALPNGIGVLIVKSTDNTVSSNLLSGNGVAGVWLGDDFATQNPQLNDALKYLPPPIAKRQNGSGTQFTSGNVVSSNRIGTNESGQNAVPNGIVGVQVGENARDNIVGGNRRSGEGNYIAGHTLGQSGGTGVHIGSIWVDVNDERLPRNNNIQGNFIGWGVGFAEIANGTGILIRGAADNFIGADPTCQIPDCVESDYGNYIGNSQGAGITFDGDGTIDNNVRGNFIGVTDTFTIGGFNAIDGIYYKAGNHNSIENNVIAGSGRDGFRAESVGGFTLESNFIAGNDGNGITVDGDSGDQRLRRVRRPEGSIIRAIIGNSVGRIVTALGVEIHAENLLNGIELRNAFDTLIGPSSSGRRTIIVNSGGDGIKVTGGDSDNIRIVNTTVGTDSVGSPDIGNEGDGIRVDGAPNVVIGGSGEGNVVSGNNGNGISVENANNTNILGNSIGVVPLQTSVRLSNQRNGVSIRNSSNNSLGGFAAALSNIISGNAHNGILISGLGSSANRVSRNFLGTDLVNAAGLGNGQNGVRVTNGANNNVIGDDHPDNGNTVSGNGANGIQIDNEVEGQPRSSGSPSSLRNVVRNNSIFLNTGRGIALSTGDRVENDLGDADTGPNNLQNYPQINQWQIVNGDLLLNYRVDSLAAHSNYGASGIYVEFLKSDLSGEGERFIGSNYWTLTDLANGGKVINLGNAAAIGITPTDMITATATDADGNTSEFFPPFAPTAANVSISGRVTTPAGAGISRATLTLTSDDGQVRRVLTNNFGRYRFEDVEVGRTYLLSVSSRRYQFENPSRALVLDDELTDVDFMSLP